MERVEFALKMRDLGGTEVDGARRHPGFFIPLEKRASRGKKIGFFGALTKFAVGLR